MTIKRVQAGDPSGKGGEFAKHKRAAAGQLNDLTQSEVISSQEELDKALASDERTPIELGDADFEISKDTERPISIRSGNLRLNAQAVVHASEGATVTATRGTVAVTVAHCEASGTTFVVGRGKSTVRLDGEAAGTIYDSTVAVARGRSDVQIYGQAKAHLHDTATGSVYSEEGAMVLNDESRGSLASGTAETHGKSRVSASGTAYVESYGRSHTKARVLLSDNVSAMLHDDAKASYQSAGDVDLHDRARVIVHPSARGHVTSHSDDAKVEVRTQCFINAKNVSLFDGNGR